MLPIAGQGIFVFSCDKPAQFNFYDPESMDGILVEFTKHNVIVSDMKTSQQYIDQNNKKGLVDSPGAYYWFSIDSHNKRLCAGIGEPRMETMIYSFELPDRKSLSHIYFKEPVCKIRIIKDPVTRSVPMIVKDVHELTMDDVASSKYMPIANLSPTCQKLYNCISGEKFVLDTPDFPDFTQAIEYSIKTPGKWCYQKLIDKSREFGSDPLETYLRITLGQNSGESPGVPYVMEIWPVGHYSPIHSHAGADAIIRVLNGEINVKLFPFLGDDVPFGEASFMRGDITWITPTLNTTHQLRNLKCNSYTCITIQCYMYENDSKKHYDYFDYIDENGHVQQYDPDSDMDFIKFKEMIRTEWTQLKNTDYSNI